MMVTATTIRLAQDRETPATVVRRAHYAARYAYARASDTRAADDCGQDYLAFRDDDRRLVFALCDGVSQSFFGDLAARIVGEALLNWLWEDLSPLDDAAARSTLTDRLGRLSAAATKEVERFPLPPDLPPIVRDVLERKRALGSQTTFVAGIVDTEIGRVLLAWMGDSRVRLWALGGERTNELGDAFHTRERWSTRLGPLGRVHTFAAALANIERILVYSDGLPDLRTATIDDVDDEALNALIGKAMASAASDDISLLEIRFHPEGVPLPAPPVPTVVMRTTHALITWQLVPDASHYELEIQDGVLQHVRVTQPPWSVQRERMRLAGAVRVRAWSAQRAGQWSGWIALPQPDRPARPMPETTTTERALSAGRPGDSALRGAASGRPRPSLLLAAALLGVSILVLLALFLHWLH